MLINLGVGRQRSGSQQTNSGAAAPSVNGDGDGEEPDEEMAEEEPEQDDRQLLSLVIEEFDERFPGDEGAAMIDDILHIMKESNEKARTSNNDPHATTTNGISNMSLLP